MRVITASECIMLSLGESSEHDEFVSVPMMLRRNHDLVASTSS